MVYQTTGYEEILYNETAKLLGISSQNAVLFITVIVFIFFIWKLIWYSLALYKTIERKQKIWFIVLFVCAFVLGDLGILAMIYLYRYRDKKKDYTTLENFNDNKDNKKKKKKSE